MNIQSNPPDSVNRRGPIWSWAIGILIPLLFLFFYKVIGTHGGTYDAPFLSYYFYKIGYVMVLIITSPLYLFPFSAFGNIGGIFFWGAVLILPWVLIGRGLYLIYHSRWRILFWLLLIGAPIAILIAGYIATGEYRAMTKAKTTGNTAACIKLEEGPRKYCFMDAAKFLNDPSICEQIEGVYRISCCSQLIGESSETCLKKEKETRMNKN